jgi:hypothetical protein
MAGIYTYFNVPKGMSRVSSGHALLIYGTTGNRVSATSFAGYSHSLFISTMQYIYGELNVTFGFFTGRYPKAFQQFSTCNAYLLCSTATHATIMLDNVTAAESCRSNEHDLIYCTPYHNRRPAG